MEALYHEAQSRGPMISPRELARRFDGMDLSAWRALDAVFPGRITRSWAGRMRHVRDALARQVLPDMVELEADGDDISDPVGEQGRMPVPWVVQKHSDRALLLVTRRCHVHCRYCFRRDLPGSADPSTADLDRAIDYLSAGGLEEVILSGGDPLALRNAQLFEIIDRLRPHVPIIRIHTRAPITEPSRVTPSLVAGLADRQPTWVVVHANHPDELDEAVSTGLARLVDAGIPVMNQAVLLRGVNDDADVLAALSRALVRRRVRPYYLHHPDHAPGNAAFRLSPTEGLEIYRSLRAKVSGLALPAYMIDPPDGTGKVPVEEWTTRLASRPVPSR
jgi:lysine 2,3-aminomutase